MSSIDIKEVQSKSDRNSFIDFPHKLYAEDKNYVPEIFLAVEELMDFKKNPFFKHSEAKYFLAYRDNEIVGRIAAIINRNYNSFHNSNVGFFGLFDSVNDQEVANTLLDTAVTYCRSHHTDHIMGPANLSTNDTAGLLVEGFDSPPVVQMTYNFPYYKDLLENYGFEKDMDMFAFWIPTDTVNDKALNLAARIKERLENKGITFRNVKLNNFDSEAQKIKEIYRSAWEKNWGFFPPTDEEFEALAKGLKMILDEKYVYMAEENGNLVAFAVGLPDINEIMINVKKGRLFPFGLIKLLWGKSRVKKIRIVLLGVKEAYRKIGIEAVFYANFIKTARDQKLLGGEASWILESNQMMVQGAENLNGKKYKTYRIYTKKI